MTAEELKRFDQASNHPYECGCDICKEWWDAVGPEPEDDGSPYCECGAVSYSIEELDSNRCDCCGKAVE